jgi:membrane protease subunit HflK
MKNVTPIKFKLPPFFKPARIVIIVIVLLVLAVFSTSFYTVDQTEEAVVTRFGKYLATRQPGLQFQLPFGIDRHYLVPTQVVQTEQFGFRTIKSSVDSTYSNRILDEATMLTGDLNIVEVEWIIQYRIVDPVAWTFNVNDQINTIRDVARSAVSLAVGDRAVMDVMGSARSDIQAQAMDFMNKTFKIFKLGIDVIAVKLQNVDPPQGVQAAFDDVNKSVQDMNRLINEGQQVYNSEIPKARGQAQQQILEAQGYAAERVNRAKGDVARFNSVYAEYKKAPEVTRRRLYYEMIENVFKNDGKSPGGETVIIGKGLRNFLPMRELGGAVKKAAEAQK